MQISLNYMQYSERAIVVSLILINIRRHKGLSHAEKYTGNSTIDLEKGCEGALKVLENLFDF